MNRSDRRDSAGQSADLRTRIAAVHQAHRWGVFRCSDGYARTCCRCQWREKPDGPTHAEHVADAVIRELTNPIRGCTDPWHWSTGEPYRCPSCGYWMGEGYV